MITILLAILLTTQSTHPPKPAMICVEIHSLGEVHWSQTVPVVDKLPYPGWQMRFLWPNRTLYTPSGERWATVGRAHYRYKHGPCE